MQLAHALHEIPKIDAGDQQGTLTSLLSILSGVQWILLPAIPAAWLVFGVLLMSAAVVTKHAFQPPLYAHRPIPMYECEFFRWWLVQRMTGLTTVLFADQLRGTPFLVGWFRALVRSSPLQLCPPWRTSMLQRFLPDNTAK